MKIYLYTALSFILIFCPAATQDRPMSIGEKFHHETGFDEHGAVSDNLKFGDSLPLYKTYRDSPKAKLPPIEFSGLSFEDALRLRQSVRNFKDSSISPDYMSILLQAAYGITRHSPGELNSRRTVPSGGALYPMEIYVVINNVEGFDAGLYHFQVSDHSLELIREGTYAGELNVAANRQACVGRSPITVILAARFDRSTRKYADRGYRYTYIEAGAICQNIYLQATSLGLGTVAVGAFNDAALNELLQIDGQNEAAILIMPVGWPH